MALVARNGMDPMSMTPIQVWFQAMCLREERREELLMMASAATVPHLDEKGQKKWWSENGDA